MTTLEINFLISLFGAISILLIGFYVLLKDYRSELNKVFFLFAFSGFLWGIGSGLWNLFGISTVHSWLYYFRFYWIGVAFLGPTFLHTCILIYKKRRHTSLFLLYLPAFVTIIFIYSPFFLYQSPYPTVTPFIPHPLFKKGFTFCFLLYLFLGEALIFKKYISLKSKEEKEKIKYYIIGSLLPIVGAGITNLLIPLTGLYSLSSYGFMFFVLGFLIAGYGITQRKLFIDYREVLDIVFKELTELVIVTDFEGVILMVGDATLRELGYSSEEIKDKFLFDVLAEGRKSQKEIFDELSKGRKFFDKEIEFLSKDKKRIPFLVRGFAQKNRIILVGKDVEAIVKESEQLEEKIRERTEDLKRSQRALMNILEDVEEARAKAIEERNKTMAVITNFADGLLFFDKEEKLSLINPVAEDLLELRATEVIGKSFGELREFPRMKTIIESVKSISKKVFRKEIKICENLVLEVTITPVLRGKERLGTLLVFHDISREKLVEKMKTEFVSLAAHQLRILDGDLGKISKEQREFLEKTYQSNERMIGLINDLLNVTRIEEGRYLYKLSSVSIESLVKEVIKNYDEQIKRKEIKLSFTVPKVKLPPLKLDKEKIKLAISNFIDNAVRYTPSKGKISISLKKINGKEIKFAVKDSGIGIPRDQQHRLFTKFFRAANAIRTETEGSGLGLFITKNIVEAHGGRVGFESEEGKGSTFYFILPLKSKKIKNGR